MDLINLEPAEVEFDAGGLALTFRPYNIADDLRARKLCGGHEELIAAFKQYNFEKISLVAWYQLTLESQKAVLEKVQLGRIDPETDEFIESDYTSIDKFRSLFSGMKDQVELLSNLSKCKGLNIPDMDDEDGLKKFIDQLAKVEALTGQ